MYTEEINKAALSVDYNKIIQTFDNVTTLPQETPAVFLNSVWKWNVKCAKSKRDI